MAGTLADVLPIEILPEVDRRELAGHWFVVFEGLVKVLLLDENGRELLISLHSRGEFFGELVIFEDKVPRDGTAVCVIPTTVFQIEREGPRRFLCWRILRHGPRRARDRRELLS